MHSGLSGGRRLISSLAAAAALLGLLAFAGVPCPALAEDAAADDNGESVNADENIPDEDTRRMVHWNEYEGRWFTARLGGGFLYDTASYSQDSDSEAQFDFQTDDFIRDSRLVMKGR